MRSPGGWDTGCTSARVELRITFQDQGAFVLHPFHHLAFLDLQGLSPGSRANPVPVPAAPLNHLHGGLITHLSLPNPDCAAGPSIIAISAFRDFFTPSEPWVATPSPPLRHPAPAAKG